MRTGVKTIDWQLESSNARANCLWMNHHGRCEVLCTATLRTYPYLAFLSAAPASALVVTCHLRRRHHVRVPEYRLFPCMPQIQRIPVVCAAEVGTRDSGSCAEITKLHDGHVKRLGRHFRQEKYGFREHRKLQCRKSFTSC